MRRFVGLMAATTLAAGLTTALTAPDAVAAPSAAPAPFTAQQSAGARPPMGWNSWNKFGCNINEELIRETADAIVSSGLKDAGYQYVNIDDCWAEHDRNAEGKFEPNHQRFPHGIKALADYVHSKGLKLGIYTSAGTMTCAATMPGGLDHEDVDAQTFAGWGVDYLKYDNCNNQGRPAIERYTKMGEAIKKTGRPMLYALCEWGENQPWLWGKGAGAQLWRTTGDISDNWSSMTGILDQQVGLEKYSGPGGWNDPDMLEVGNGGMTDAEYRSHFALWSLMNAPLLAGNDIRTMPEATRKILENKEIVALDQDFAGTQGHKVRDDGDTEVWAKPMSDGSAAVVLFNRGLGSATMTSSAAELGLSGRDFRVRDLWTGANTESTGPLRAQVPSHGSAVFRVWPAKAPNAAPATTLSLDPGQYFPAGRPFTAKLSLSNDGSTPVVAARVKLTAPAGWRIDGRGEVFVPAVLPGRTWSRSVEVLPVKPTGDQVSMSARASYFTAWGARTLTADASGPVVTPLPSGVTPMSKAPFVLSENGWGPVERGTSNGENQAGDGHPITIDGQVYPDGLGAHAPSLVRVYLGGGCTSFSSIVGLDDELAAGSVTFEVRGDGKTLASTGVLRPGAPAQSVNVPLKGVKALDLVITDGGDGNDSDHADWADAAVSC
ncbi:NPCBM/NEW2 domain-containing protein [Amycolatopsis sp. PS_44_ISF1]|uniref:NPCBM/NEW2 domain-containing protein n=1 Tax=Amycolatopsis sp. PS_44_ISF1 TaxID=2974917 RepID=UPI0028DDC457|nr:NPCBM/NEW2 domain-containing protein [Amycolatopsis sp. PS_44_ISF1]MDT8911627.1 NPCBM/NEW2 domain-containing protein [Amycolatopsis sp. PS_44_ISF1]